MKRLVFLVALLVLVSVMPATAQAVTADQTNQVRVAKFWIGQKYYEVNGQQFEMDVAPYVDENTYRTMMPFRYLAYSLGIPESGVEYWEDKNGDVYQVRIERKDVVGGYEYCEVYPGSDALASQGGRSQMDAVPVIVNDRTMVPYRACAQELGALVFWNNERQEVTMVTWKDLPAPITSSINKVEVYKDQARAKVDGREVKTTVPVMITDTRDGGVTVNVAEWLKLWGVPDNAILVDLERGGVMVRGVSGRWSSAQNNKIGAAFAQLYANDKYAWGGGALKTPVGDGANFNFIKDGQFYSGGALGVATQWVFGDRELKSGFCAPDGSVLWQEFE